MDIYCYMYSSFPVLMLDHITIACPSLAMLPYFKKGSIKGAIFAKKNCMCVCLVLHLYRLILRV